ncbi:uncharacterized protein LOC131216693 [Anopheles bellator]|uniref:uncharacterized protein LOC131216693 n=1 Tax=Anopheles bellator TaxID=139047 RepID=UPI00264834AC|nr:uncharacterized protein LOC131216693 [Anopheles bellator]
MEGSPPKANRKVRFSLPEPAVPAVPSTPATAQKQRMAHGTVQYVNGTLISQPASGSGAQSQRFAPAAPTNQHHHHQTLQVTATATTVPSVSSVLRPKELNNKIVLHLRPSVSSLDGSGSGSGGELSPKGCGPPPPLGASIDGAAAKSTKPKPLTTKATGGIGGSGGSTSRSLRGLPQINQKYPSSEDVNNNLGPQSIGVRQRPDELGLGWNHPSKKPTLILRTITSGGVGPGQQQSGVGKPFPPRNRAKSVGKLSVGHSIGPVRPHKTLISSHLQPLEGGGGSGAVVIRVQDNGPGKPALDDGLSVGSIIRPTNGNHAPVIRKVGTTSNFLAVPEYSDRYEGMETVVSATALHDEEDEDEYEDSSEQDESGAKRTAADKDDPSASGSSGGASSGSAGVNGDDASFRCSRDTKLGRDKNSAQFWDFVERWRTNRALKKLENSNHEQPTSASSLASVSIGTSHKSDAKSPTLSSRIRALRMSLEQVPTVTTLLRASRDANEYLLKEVFRDILENGISKENLNSTDRSGRTAISYICSTNLTNFLELFLQLPGIDVNKPDNEGNTPLHFAAQAGLSDVVNMLITKCRSLVIDPKNNLGFTPLMKAALQGRTRCAKLLLFAGASPVETDAGRGFRAEQWARFCGRHTCAETIEQCARARLLDKSTPCGRWSHDINLPVDKNALKARSCSITPQSTQNGFRSKFRKVFPFNFNSSKDKPASKEGEENYTKDLVNYLKSATLCVSGPALSANRKIIQSLIRPLEVPKLEVTYANNNALIKKYEATAAATGATENGTANGRRDSVDGAPSSTTTTDSRHGTPQPSPVLTRAKVRN